MPWIALLCLGLVGACRFDADYSGATLRCSDDNCPSDLECRVVDDVPLCLEKRMDAAIDTPMTMDTPDARVPAMSCADPHVFATNGGSHMNTTMGRTSKIGAQCVSVVMNGPDAVHRINPGGGRTMLITIDATWQATAYLISPCPSSPCLQTMYAIPGNPISVTAIAGDNFVVVDSVSPTSSGDYTLTITF